MINTQKFKTKRITEAGAWLITDPAEEDAPQTPSLIIRIDLFGGEDATFLAFFDVDENPLLEVNVSAGQTKSVDFSRFGGIYYSSPVYVKVVGTNAFAVITYEER
jgi:hypothetical protein